MPFWHRLLHSSLTPDSEEGQHRENRDRPSDACLITVGHAGKDAADRGVACQADTHNQKGAALEKQGVDCSKLRGPNVDASAIDKLLDAD